MTTIKSFHLSIMPAMILRLHRDLKKPIGYFLDGVPEGATELDLEIQLLQDIRDGKIYTIGNCDNQDERGACKGHIKEEKDDKADND